MHEEDLEFELERQKVEFTNITLDLIIHKRCSMQKNDEIIFNNHQEQYR